MMAGIQLNMTLTWKFHPQDFVKRNINSISGLSIISSGFVLDQQFLIWYFTRLAILAAPMCIVYKCCYVKIMCVFISTFIDVIKLYK